MVVGCHQAHFPREKAALMVELLSRKEKAIHDVTTDFSEVGAGEETDRLSRLSEKQSTV